MRLIAFLFDYVVKFPYFLELDVHNCGKMIIFA